MFRIVMFLLWSSLASAAENWLRLRSPNFEVYTSAGERAGRQALEHFEQVLGFFEGNLRLQIDTSTPVRVILFRSEDEGKEYNIREALVAYYLPGAERDTIVMRRGASDVFRTAVHEFVHLVLRRSPDGGKIPIWLNEGLAEIFSTLTPTGKKLQVGQFIPGRLESLAGAKWLDLETLFEVDHKSPHYNDKKHMGVFYGQSWLLTHMLFLSDAYRPKFAQFNAELVSGTKASDALWKVYAKSVNQVMKDLQDYRSSNLIKVLVFDGKLTKAEETYRGEAVPDYERELVLTSLLQGLQKSDEARKRYLALRDANPDKPEVYAGLAYLELREGKRETAVPYFQQAVAKGSQDPKLYVDYSYALVSTRAPATTAIPVLEKASDLNPANVELRLQLANALIGEKRYEQAVSRLESVKRVNPDRAFDLFRMMAYAYYQSNRLDEAKKAAGRAKEHAKEVRDVQWLDQLIASIEQPRTPGRSAVASPPGEESSPTLRRATVTESVPAASTVQRFEGVLTMFECASPHPLLHVKAGGRLGVFAIQNPNDVVVKKAGSEGPLEFACGSQRPTTVIVEYQSSPSRFANIVQGVVKSIEIP